MQFISSDTNVWIDFSAIERVHLPFLLPYTYIMSKDAVEEELLAPGGLGAKLKSCGLVPVEITLEEFILAQQYGTQYRRLSIFDRIALAMAKEREIVLFTGDAALRKAADQEDVRVIGTIGILDQLYAEGKIDGAELKYCLEQLRELNGGVVRLPNAEIEKRLMHL